MVKLKFLLLLVAFLGVSMSNHALADEKEESLRERICNAFFFVKTKELEELTVNERTHRIQRIEGIRQAYVQESIIASILLAAKPDVSQEDIAKQSLKLQAYSLLPQVNAYAPASCYPKE